MKYLAIDIGGSAIKSAIIDAEGNIYEKTSLPTPQTNFEDFMERLTQIVHWGNSLTHLSGIALSQPCVTNSETAEALSEGALIYIKNTNPAKLLGEKFNLPYSAENDGNCAALAEIWIGGAKSAKDIALVVCGSGIGGAVVIDRKIKTGVNRFAGEFGMFVMGTDELGAPLTWSFKGATLSLVKDYALRVGKDYRYLDGKKVFEYADAGDSDAIASVDSFFRYFAFGVHNIQHVYDPELILIGGAISGRHDFIERLEVQLDWLNNQIEWLLARPKVAICECGADANLLGAVYHLLNNRMHQI